MSMNTLNDISAVYVAEILKPKLGQDSPQKNSESSETQSSGGGSEDINKKARQLVYDIKYEVKKSMGSSTNMSPAEVQQAYMQGLQKSKSSPLVKSLAKKILMGSGKNEDVQYDDQSVDEERKTFKVRVRDKKTGNTYVTNASRNKISTLRSNPNISSVEMTKYGTPIGSEKYSGKQTASVKAGKGLDPVGREDGDIDNDGDRDNSDKYLINRRKKIGNSIKKRKVEESFSNWRNDLREVVDDEIEFEKKSEIKEMPKSKQNKITINPKISESIQIIESVELSENYIMETADNAAQCFIQMGLNEDGVEILIDELGLDEFVNFVFEINTEVINEARSGGVKISPTTKAGKPVSQLKGGARTAAINRLRKEKEARRSAETAASASKPSGMKAALQRQSAVANAKKQQPKKKGILDRVAGAVLQGIERHNAAMSAAKETGKTISKAAKVGAKGASEFGKGVVSGVKGTAAAVKKANKVLNAGYEVDGDQLDEKAVSQNQQQLAGMALKYIDGDMPNASDAVKKMAKMGRTELRKFAKTKHKGLPEVKESIVDQPGSADNQVRNTQDDTVRKQQMKKKEQLMRQQQALDRQKMLLQRAGRLPVNSGYEPDGNLVAETEKLSALDIVRKRVIAKHGAASLMGTPENEAARKAAAAKAKTQPKPSSKERYKDDVYSKDGLGGIRGYRSGD